MALPASGAMLIASGCTDGDAALRTPVTADAVPAGFFLSADSERRGAAA